LNLLFRLAVPASLALSLAACGQNASLPAGDGGTSAQSFMESHAPTQHFMGIRGSAAPATGLLKYHNGAVQTTPQIYVVFWGFNAAGADPNGEQAYLTSFLSGVGGSSWLNTVTQYYMKKSGVTTYISNPSNQLVSTWVDTASIPKRPTDTQIQNEARKAAGHFGNFSPNASYVVATSHNHYTTGFGTVWCAYHGESTYSGKALSYTNLPYISDAGGACGEGIVNNPGTLDGVSIVAGHELAESQTDPSPPSGWTTASGSEIGDLCAWQDLANITLSSGTFPVQPLYDNAQSACELSGP
jgi:serine protease